jgi:haloalkane dehalogenase
MESPINTSDNITKDDVIANLPHSKPEWLNTKEYPFTSHFAMIEGYSMHYVDEGQGEVLLMVHGTPVWSFLYRHCIQRLSARYRCVALDHLGFGLSDKPSGADYTPQAHAQRLRAFIEKLGLKNITIITQDYGGPIALDYAVHHAENVRRIVIANSWMWSLPQMEQGGKLFNNALGKWLYLRYGFSAKVLIPQSFGDKRRLSSEIHGQYLSPLNTPQNRIATFALVQALSGNGEWYAVLNEKSTCIAVKPVLMLWGMRDRFVPAAQLLPLWKKLWTNARYVEIDNAGHFVEEEASGRVTEEIERFLHETDV